MRNTLQDAARHRFNGGDNLIEEDKVMLAEETILLTDVVREAAHPLVGEAEDYDPLMKVIGDAPLAVSYTHIRAHETRHAVVFRAARAALSRQR